ncbi:glutaredoxin family protein [Bacillus pinisoli]|uniref:glutaredoxin family protein n=1 Tax=Bacillus pinisoli TaxID=2901866 RepID=UPI001FF42C05|nr:glutaredoxin family protein [Bacillus pinisoli]
MKNQVIVYSSNDCIECIYVKKTLEDYGIPFEVRNVSENEDYRKEVQKYGFLGVPVTVVEGRAIKGLNHELLELLEDLKSK